MKKLIAGIAAGAAAVLALTGCGGAPAADSSAASLSPDQVAGDVKVITWRTDLLQDGTLDQQAAEFKKIYPNVNVSFEGITDYEGQIAIRLNTKDYGDVLAIPNSVKPQQYSTFFEPLGSAEELSAQYRFTAPRTFEGQVYGIATGGNANGIVYNKSVFAAAGVTELPKTPEAFLATLEQIKDSTDAIPLYTNYKDGWPLSQWFSNLGSQTGSADAQTTMTTDDAPWRPGTDIYAIDSLIYRAVADGLIEDDPLTTNWEKSKGMMGSGKIATMALGSWAISQMQAAAEDAGASPDDIGYLAFPVTAPDGRQHAIIAGDYSLAVNVNSAVKPAARAWIDWYVNKSGYAEAQGMISPAVDAPLPANLKDMDEAGVTLLELNPAPAGQESLLADLYNEAEIDLTGSKYRQKLVDIARGAADGDMESYFASLNDKWARARANVG